MWITTVGARANSYALVDVMSCIDKYINELPIVAKKQKWFPSTVLTR